MLDFLLEYGLFLAKAATVVVVIVLVVAISGQVASRRRQDSGGHLEVTHLNDEYEDMAETLKEHILDKVLLKKQRKEEKKAEKAEAKARQKQIKQGKDIEAEHKKRVFVLDFDGDIKASEADSLREEISAVLTLATERDEVLVRLESAGGLVHSYGLAASQLQRIRDRNIPLVVAVDKVAASGGYMMACIANQLIAAPFAVIGSIGVVAQIPNFHRLLKKHDVDMEVMTAGEYKRTLTMFGENTDAGRRKFQEDLEDTHLLFKDFVAQHRSQVDIDEVANGDIWFGTRALEKRLVDRLMTSDEYLYKACEEADVYQVRFVEKKSLPERFGISFSAAIDRVLLRWLERAQKSRFLS